MAVTLTSTAIANNRAIPLLHAGVTTNRVSYNSSSTSISASAGATTVLLMGVPNKTTIVELIEYHTTGAATCPTSFGVQGAATALISGATQGTVNRMSVTAQYDVSVSDSAVAQYKILTCTPVPGTDTASFKVDVTVFYVAD